MVVSGPQVYWADGAGSRAVFDSLMAILDELRAAVVSDRALALHQPATSAYDQYFVLSDSCRDSLEPALANERLRVDQPQDLREAGQVLHVAASSALRPLRLRLASAVALPWNDAFGRGVVLVGTYEDELPGENLKRLQATASCRRPAPRRSGSARSWRASPPSPAGPASPAPCWSTDPGRRRPSPQPSRKPSSRSGWRRSPTP